jgi:cellobiose transport system substrate-binding protein
MHRTAHRLAPVVCLIAAAALTVTACSSSKSGGSSNNTSSSSSGSGSANAAPNPCGTSDQTTLTVGLFGTFGFKENGLYDAYKTVCPNITIKEDDVEQSADYWTRLKTRLASGSGLDDVQAIEIGFVADVVQNHASQFVNFNSLSNSAALKASFYPWKWGQASTADGRTRHRLRARGDLLSPRPALQGRPAQ